MSLPVSGVEAISTFLQPFVMCSLTSSIFCCFPVDTINISVLSSFQDASEAFFQLLKIIFLYMEIESG